MRHATRFEVGPFTIVPAEGFAARDGQPLMLTPKAFDLLAFMVTNAGRLLTKDELLRSVWPDAVVEEQNLAYHISAIRKALGDDSESERYIETVPKRGYRFTGRVARIEPAAAETAPIPPPTSAPSEPAAAPTRPGWRGVLALVVLTAAGAAGATGWWTASPRLVPELRHFQEPPWGRWSDSTMFSISPDARHLLMAIQGADGMSKLWIRTLTDPAPRPLPESDGIITPPAIWSPDSDAVAFGQRGPLKRVFLSAGVPQTLCDLRDIAVGGSWSRKGVILVGNPAGPILRCLVASGVVEAVTATTDTAEIHLMPSFLSDGRHFLYLRVNRAIPERSGVFVRDLEGGVSAPETRLLTSGFNAIPVPESEFGPSAVVYLRDRALMAQRFDEARMELRGAPVKLADAVGSFIDYAFFSASPRVLAYRPPTPPYQLTWFDRRGHEAGRVGAPEPLAGLAVSPAGDRVIVARDAAHEVAAQDLWLIDLTAPANPTRLTYSPLLERDPVWVTGDRFAYGAGGGGDGGVFEQTIGGQSRPWFPGHSEPGWAIAAEGRIVVFSSISKASSGLDLWVKTERGPGDGSPLLVHEGDQSQPQLSPDVRWLAYVSNETGRSEVFVAPFRYDASTGQAAVGVAVPVSGGGGQSPRWRSDGRELLYLQADGSVMAAAVTAASGVSRSAQRLFRVPGVFPEWGVTRDGKRLLLAVPTAPPPPLHLIDNWQSVLPE